ncbi:MAG TPA: glycosyltransferase family 87 protein [Anaerolineales bacterium]
MEARRSTANLILVILLALAVLAGLTWANLRFVTQSPGGNDFLVHWVGTRAFLLEGLSPYSDQVATRIQTLAYGRPAQAGEHELRVAYPLYSTLLFAPFALISDFNLARAFWMTAMEVGLVLLAVTSLRLTGWQPKTWMLVFYLLFALLWYHSIRPLVNGNAVIVVALFFSAAFLSIRSGRDELAGILLALSTIKPQLALLLVLFVLLWAISAGRWRLVVALVGTSLFLVFGAMLFLPDWPLQNLREVLRYPAYNPPGSPQAAFLAWWPGVGKQLGWILTALLSGILIAEWVAARGKDYRWFVWTACLTLVISQWIGIQTDPGNFIILFPALALVFGMLEERWSAGMRGLVLFSMVLLGVGLWALFLATVGHGTQPQQNPIMFFPLPLFLLLGLYWVRWWAVQSKRPLLEQLRSRQSRLDY